MRGKLLLVAMLVACGGGQKPGAPVVTEPAPPLTPDGVVAAGKGVVEQYRQAYEVRSMEALGTVYSRGLDVVVVHQGQPYHGWSDVQAHLEELLERAEAIHVTVRDVYVVALGPEGAAAFARVDREVSGSVTTVKESGVLTLALRLENQRWVIVSEHFSYRPTSD